MKAIPALAAALTCLALAACSDPSPPASSSASARADQGGPKTFIGRHVDKALEEARKELATQNISLNGDFDININGRKVHNGGGETLPKAEISPQGDLLIEGKSVAINPAQRAELLAYRSEIVGIAEAGMTIGGQGADLAGEALSGVVGAIFGGDQGREDFEKRMEARGKEIEAEALKLCAHLPRMLASQQALAATLPEFEPYARLTQADVDDCGKEGDDSGVAVSSEPI